MKDFYKSSFPGSYFAQQHREKGYNTTTDTKTRRISTNSLFFSTTQKNDLYSKTQKKQFTQHSTKLNFASIELEQCGVEAVKCGESPAFAFFYTVGNIFSFFGHIFVFCLLCVFWSIFFLFPQRMSTMTTIVQRLGFIVKLPNHQMYTLIKLYNLL